MLRVLEAVKSAAMGYRQCVDIPHSREYSGVDHLDFGDETLTLSGEFDFPTPKGPVPHKYLTVLTRKSIRTISCSEVDGGWGCTLLTTDVLPGQPSMFSYELDSYDEVCEFQRLLKNWLEK